MAGAISIISQPRQHVLAISLDKCALIRARGVKDQMIKAPVDVMDGTKIIVANLDLPGDKEKRTNWHIACSYRPNLICPAVSIY